MTETLEYTTHYRQVCSTSVRSISRHFALSTRATFYQVTGQQLPALKRNRVQFLSLHHVFEDEGLAFRQLLQTLGRQHRFISYSEAVNRIWSGDIDAPYVAISFDDGLKHCLRAAQILDEFGAKACFFLIGSMVGESDYQRIKAFCAQKLRLPPLEFLSWDDVETLLQAGHEVGGHTMTHPNVAELSPQQMQGEIEESFALLSRRIGHVEHFAWPQGKFSRFSPAAARVVFQTGFQSCASAERGCHVAQSEKLALCIRRDHIVAGWPISHTLYFLVRSSQEASAHGSEWPSGWVETIRA